MDCHLYGQPESHSHESRNKSNLTTIPMIYKTYQMDMAIDPKLAQETLDHHNQAEWSASLSQSSPRHSFDTPRMYSGGGISSMAQYASAFYQPGYDSSLSQQSSPGQSYNGSHTGSPSIGSEAYIPLGPATPQDSRLPAHPLYEAEDHLGFRYMTPHDPQAGAAAGALPMSTVGGAFGGSSFMDDAAAPVAEDDLCGMTMDFPTYVGDSVHDFHTCSGKGGYGSFDPRTLAANRPMAYTSCEPTPMVHERYLLANRSQHRRETLSKRASSSFAPQRGQHHHGHARSTSGVSATLSSVGKKRKEPPCAPTSPTSPSADRRYCQNCKVNFQTAKLLEDHIKAKHARPFICVFHFAGCSARFEAKNEWKRHVSTKHVSLKYWLCLEGNCAQSRGSPTHRRTAMLPALGSIFNRKDLYTSHVRRMHPDATRDDDRDGGGRRQASGVSDRLKRMQEGALRKRLDILPDHMACPVVGCGADFHGSNAWNERMEHVAQKHFDYSSPDYQADVGFGGSNDAGLTAWASRGDVQIIKRTSSGGWCLCEPLKGENDCKRRHQDMSDGEMDMDVMM